MRTYISRFLFPSYLKRFLFFLLADIILFSLSLLLSFLFHFDFEPNVGYFGLVVEVLPFFIVIKLVFFTAFRIYKMTWRYVGIFDLVNIVAALVVSAMVLIILSLRTPLIPLDFAIIGFPKRIILEDSIISVFLVAGLRISKRLYQEVIRKQRPAGRGKRTIVIGAGNTGEFVVRDMARNNFHSFYPVAFLDDDKRKIGTYIHGVKVFGPVSRLAEIIVGHDADAVIVAIQLLNHKLLKAIYDSAKEAGVDTIKIVPRIYNFDKPDVSLKGLEDISIEDLVGRQTINIDCKEIAEFLNNKSVLVTGAGGSIGSEIVGQVCAYHPASLILFDIDETELHNLGLRLARLFPSMARIIHYVTGDVRDETRLKEVFEAFRPQIVYHAAAYKHVPMMEYNPKEAVKVNILGTHALANTAKNCGVDKFIMISTDKAVRPTSIMGGTKRIAEYICKALNGEDGEQRGEGRGKREEGRSIRADANPTSDIRHPTSGSTKFISVRFGNVLGSRGSVLPLFLDQLKHGGPLTVTHKEMKRYFMTIPEAVSLVLQASTIGDGGEVLVLDMGEPAYITDVAEELIRMHGLEPYKDIDIQFTGLRPGEKLFEEILTAEEGTVTSKHDRIFIANNGQKYSLPEIGEILQEFRDLLSEPTMANEGRVKELLKKYVRHYEETGKDSL